MPLLKDTRTEPPGGWRYTQPETGLEVRGGSLGAVIAKVMEHRRYKRLPREQAFEISVDVQRQLCSNLPPEFSRPEPDENP